MKYEAEVNSAIAAAAPAWGVDIDPNLVHAIIRAESSDGAVLQTAEPGGHTSYGPMMVLDSTATSVLGVSDPTTLRDPATGIYYGVQYLASLLDWANDDVNRAISAYNAGKGNANMRADGTYPNQSYVVRVLGYWNAFARGVAASAPVSVPLILIVGALIYVATRRRRAA